MTDAHPGGGCACGELRYRMTARPMFVHCCHCRWCQRETGAAFALNALVETARIEVTTGTPETIETPSESGRGQAIVRCPRCRVALWSHYSGAGPGVSFLRVGTLDEPGACPPDIHIFTASKQAWVPIPADADQVDAFYRFSDYWPEDSLARFRAAKSGQNGDPAVRR